ncbi:MAG TPA: hypothetical protein VEL79_21855 [Vicinamibacterales bacterium]|nr:hypothetical protein [Vicinamibacterales bacterium]
MRAFTAGAILLATLAAPARARVQILQSTGGIPAHIAGSFREPMAFQETDAGQYFIFDRRGHAVFTIAQDAAKKIVEIGAETGRVLDPTAFDIDAAHGTFVIADAPLRKQRIQMFTAEGVRMSGFTLLSREVARITLGTMVLNGIGSIQFTGHSVLINQAETGALISELGPFGQPIRAFGELRATGQESDPDVHLGLNAGLPLIDPSGGFYFVFSAGVPMFRKYDGTGRLLFERHIEGPEVDEYVRTMPARWPKRTTGEGDLLPLIPPAIRTAGVDRQGRLWIALTQPFTYVYDGIGEKIATVQFKGADILLPNSLFFSKDGRILVTPGCYEFRVDGLRPSHEDHYGTKITEVLCDLCIVVIFVVNRRTT